MVALELCSRDQIEFSISDKNRLSDCPKYRRQETDYSATQCDRPNIALQHYVIDDIAFEFLAVAQLPVIGIGIAVDYRDLLINLLETVLRYCQCIQTGRQIIEFESATAVGGCAQRLLTSGIGDNNLSPCDSGTARVFDRAGDIASSRKDRQPLSQ